MSGQPFGIQPKFSSYDVVIIGGAIMGSATAWFLSADPDFDGRVLVIERDPSYQHCSTAHTNSCMRQQFSTALNVQISQFAAEFVTNLRDNIGDDRVPDMAIQNFGYMYLADNAAFADTLRQNQKIQLAAGTQTELLSADEISARYPFYNTDDILLGSINTHNEGYWDGGGVFDWLRRSAQTRHVEYIQGEVSDLIRQGATVTDVVLANGTRISSGQVVNAAGPRAAQIAKMAGLELPVEPRKRFTWVFSAQNPLDRELPLTVDPSGVHVRQDGPQTYMVGAAPEIDTPVAPDDFTMDHNRWQDHVWPILATRIPQFDAIRVVSEWAGHYAYNTLDQNAVLGAHPDIDNLFFQNGFSGHGLQQSPAMGRGMAELLTHGKFQSLDLSPFGFERVLRNAPIIEKAII
jgi:glycine/D-amino acid oxidase-like deaminating enzyme